MINQSSTCVNKNDHYNFDLNAGFFCDDLKKLYSNILLALAGNVLSLFMPCCDLLGRYGFIFYGTYTRKLVIDAKLTGFKNGIPQYKKVVLCNFKVQRIKHKKCDHTHAVLFDLFIPYQQYTIRFVLIHLKRYFSMNISIEAYCLNNKIPIKTFREWLKWLQKNMVLLTESKVVKKHQENKKNMREFLLTILDDVSSWIINSLSVLNQALFQRHSMPANYTNRSLKERLGY